MSKEGSENIEKRIKILEEKADQIEKKLMALFLAMEDALTFCQELEYVLSQMKGRIDESLNNLKMEFFR